LLLSLFFPAENQYLFIFNVAPPPKEKLMGLLEILEKIN